MYRKTPIFLVHLWFIKDWIYQHFRANMYLPKGKKENGGNGYEENEMDCKGTYGREAGQTGMEGNKGI
jgi:hypothetical protein